MDNYEKSVDEMENRESKKLFEIILHDGNEERHFEFTGQIQVVHNNVGYPFLETGDITIYEIKDSEKVLFEPPATSWATGDRLSASDAMNDVLQRYICNQTDGFKVLYVDPEVYDMAAVYKNRTALRYKGRDIPYQIIDNDMQYVYELYLATSEYLYYICDDMFLMQDIETGTLISDNYFAEVGFSESEEAIEEGTEENLVFKKYLHPKKCYESGMEYNLWKLM